MACSKVLKFDIQTGVVSMMGAGIGQNRVYALIQASNGDIIASGDFIAADGSTALRVARWNGAGWFPLGAGIGSSVVNTEIVRGMATHADGSIVVCGYIWNVASGASCLAPV